MFLYYAENVKASSILLLYEGKGVTREFIVIHLRMKILTPGSGVEKNGSWLGTGSFSMKNQIFLRALETCVRLKMVSIHFRILENWLLVPRGRTNFRQRRSDVAVGFGLGADPLRGTACDIRMHIRGGDRRSDGDSPAAKSREIVGKK